MIPQSIVNQLDSLPIVDVISRYITLRKNGANHTACCPFHNEKSASFTVTPTKNLFKCFGCGIAGGPVKFVQEYLKVDFVEACKRLGSDHGIEVETKELTPQEKLIHDTNESLYVLNAYAMNYFVATLDLPESQGVKDYAYSRWKSETVFKFQIGYAPKSWNLLLDSCTLAGFKIETMLQAGLVAERKDKPGEYFDVFRDRLMIPLFNRTNLIMGFTGRTMSSDKAKYLNTKTTPVYSKGSQLFGMNFARESIKYHDVAYLVEGNADVIRLHEIGVPNCLAICTS